MKALQEEGPQARAAGAVSWEGACVMRAWAVGGGVRAPPGCRVCVGKAGTRGDVSEPLPGLAVCLRVP